MATSCSTGASTTGCERSPPTARYVSMYDYLCDNSGCLTGIGTIQGEVMVQDTFHLSRGGALFVAPRIIDAVLGGAKPR